VIEIIRIIIGIMLLVVGRRFYWFFISAIGFLVGVTIAHYFINEESIIIELLIVILAGALSAIMAKFMQKIAILSAGSIAGGFMVSGLVSMLHLQSSIPSWLPFLIGAILGFILIYSVFEWAIILLTSSIGALLITQNIPIPDHLVFIAFIALLLIGILLQYPYKKRR